MNTISFALILCVLCFHVKCMQTRTFCCVRNNYMNMLFIRDMILYISESRSSPKQISLAMSRMKLNEVDLQISSYIISSVFQSMLRWWGREIPLQIIQFNMLKTLQKAKLSVLVGSHQKKRQQNETASNWFQKNILILWYFTVILYTIFSHLYFGTRKIVRYT